MTKIKWKLADGRVIEIDVEEAVAEVKIEFDMEDEREVWRNKKRKDKSLDYLESLGVEIPDKTMSVEDEYITNEDLNRIYSAIEKLEPQQRELINQIFFEDRTQAEIAKASGVSESAIRDRLNRIYKKLKKYLH